MSFPDVSAYTLQQARDMLDAVIDARLRRIKGEEVNSGSANGRSSGIYMMSDAELNKLEAALTMRITGRSGPQRRRICFR